MQTTSLNSLIPKASNTPFQVGRANTFHLVLKLTDWNLSLEAEKVPTSSEMNPVTMHEVGSWKAGNLWNIKIKYIV